jgi:hypothetical protein
MIVYGTNAKAIATENLYDNCVKCGTADSVQMTVFQKYATLFWIPFFPIGKTGTTECNHCKHVMLEKEFSTAEINSYKNLKAKGKTPIWTFTGLVILTALIAWAIKTGKENDALDAKYIAAPQKGDIYEFKTESDQFSLYKVDEVKGDSVFVFQNQYEANKIRGLSDLKAKGDDAFVKEQILFLKSELVSDLQKGVIMNVDRK